MKNSAKLKRNFPKLKFTVIEKMKILQNWRRIKGKASNNTFFKAKIKSKKLIEMKSVLITGGSTGIGFATAKAFIKEGAMVFITGRNPDSLNQAAKEINSPRLKTIVSDITERESISALAQTIGNTEKKLDTLFLNAGIGKFAPIEATTEEDFDTQFNTNVKGLFFTLDRKS